MTDFLIAFAPPTALAGAAVINLPKRILDKIEVDRETGCWLWTACRSRAGYGLVRWRSGCARAHRIIYELLAGPISDGLTLDHLCRVRHCVNPAHLEPLTLRENILRGTGATAANARKTHCPRGHQYDQKNTIVRANGGGRRCRKCWDLYIRIYRRANREKLLLGKRLYYETHGEELNARRRARRAQGQGAGA